MSFLAKSSANRIYKRSEFQSRNLRGKRWDGRELLPACVCVFVQCEIVVTLKMHTMKRQDGVVVKQLAVLGLAHNVLPLHCTQCSSTGSQCFPACDQHSLHCNTNCPHPADRQTTKQTNIRKCCHALDLTSFWTTIHNSGIKAKRKTVGSRCFPRRCDQHTLQLSTISSTFAHIKFRKFFYPPIISVMSGFESQTTRLKAMTSNLKL